MNPKKLRQRLEKLRAAARGGLPSKKLEEFAKALGREPKKRGKHPTYESTLFPDRAPLAIQHHSAAIPPPTAASILDELEIDLERIEEFYGNED